MILRCWLYQVWEFWTWNEWGACDLSGMCCGRTWWSSGSKVGSCPDTWPACPVSLLLSPVPSGNLRGPLEKSDLHMNKKPTLMYSACPPENNPSRHWISLLFELEEQGSYLSIRALIWSCRRRGNSSSLSRESLCFSLRNLVKFSFVMVGLLELEGTVKQNSHVMLLLPIMAHCLPSEPMPGI